MMGIISVVILPLQVRVGKQFLSFRLRLLVIEGLAVGKRLGQFENMDHGSHVSVDQAHKFEVARSGESHPEACGLHDGAGGHA